MAGKIKYLDSREDEQERGITMESSGVSLYFAVTRERKANTASTTTTTTTSNSAEHQEGNANSSNESKPESVVPVANTEYLINLIDSPGHVDFSSEVASAARLSDGAFLLVDVIEGVCTQTIAVLRQAWVEKIRPVLVLNKIDRLITEWKMTASEAYTHMQRLVEQVNAVLAGFWEADRLDEDARKLDKAKAEWKAKHASRTASGDGEDENAEEPTLEWYLEEKDDSHIYFSPELGNVLFSSAFDGWAFGLIDFARVYAPKLGISSPEKLCKVLWGDYFFDLKSKKKVLTRKQYTKLYGHGKSAAAVPLFVQLCLSNIWKVYEATIVNPNSEDIDKIISALGVKVLPRDRRSKDKRTLLTAIMQGWLPLAQACFLTAIEQMPSPITAQRQALPYILNPNDAKPKSEVSNLEKALYECNSGNKAANDAAEPVPVVAYISKMMAVERSQLPEFSTKSERLMYTAEEMRARGRESIREEMMRLRQSQSPSKHISLAGTPSEDGSISLDGLADKLESKLRLESSNGGADSGEGTPDPESDTSDNEELIGFGRIYSGTICVGQEIWAMQPKYDPEQPEQTKSHRKKVTVKALYMLMGRELVALDEVPAGNIFAIRGLESAVLKTATLSTDTSCKNFGSLRSSSAPIVRVALEPAHPRDMSRLEHGLRLLYQADPCVEVELHASGEHILVTAGELHLERCLKDLRERFAKCGIHASAPLVPFRETIMPEPAQQSQEAKNNTSSSTSAPDDEHIGGEHSQPISVASGPRGQVTVTTPNGMVTLTVKVEPLPHSVGNRLMKNHDTIRAIVNGDSEISRSKSGEVSGHETNEIVNQANPIHSEAISGNLSEDSDTDNDGEGKINPDGDGSRKSVNKSAMWLREKIRKGFKKNKRWNRRANSVVDQGIRSFGPHRTGPNLLIYDLPENTQSKNGPWYCPNIRGSSFTKSSEISGGPTISHPSFEKEDEDINANHDDGAEESHAFNNELTIQSLEEPIHTAFQLSTLSGPLCAEPLVGIAVTIKSIEINIPKDGEENEHNRKISLFGQVISTVKEAIRSGFLAWSPRLLLAMYACDIQASSEVLGKVYGVISRRRGRILSEELRDGTPYFMIKALLPVVESFGFADEIRKRTSGDASPLLIFSGFEMLNEDPFWVPTTEEELEDLGEKADRENVARRYMDAIRKRKGMFVERKLVEHAEKQRTLKK
ncbi:Cytoplasmic GTPase/eEF2-like protein (ribosomal biogenesis) [Mycoemilia scoparia]|uniref:Elongation factor-like 1 n=1 Tax=Mycoemilia scoparia TaxID=417184 RepID=A0A9W7ZPZ2_9FUNG|nr:Cytoplasmic GTPase/eEF2-like protein (ribosomal biogenesis) [Mycoemilia scoparia]